MSRLRPVVIIHLCLVFTLLSWLFIGPIASEALFHRSQRQLTELVLSDPFSELSPQLRHRVAEIAERSEQVSYHTALRSGVRALVDGHSPAFHAWLLFSLILSLLILLGVDGIAAAAWLLPLLMALTPLLQPAPPPLRHCSLIPSEERILESYLHEPLAPTIAEQHKQLARGWETYLIKEWAKEEPSTLSEGRQNQLRLGQFRFSVAALLESESQSLPPGRIAKPIWMALLIWNLFFALFVSLKSRERVARSAE